MIEYRLPKAGDILVAKANTAFCLTPGKEYLVSENQPGTPTVKCNGVCGGDTTHYLTHEWINHFSRREPMR